MQGSLLANVMPVGGYSRMYRLLITRDPARPGAVDVRLTGSLPELLVPALEASWVGKIK